MRIVMYLSYSILILAYALLLYFPFKRITAKKQKKKLIIGYGIVILVFLLINYTIDSLNYLNAFFIKMDIVAAGFCMNLLNLYFYRKRWREMLFTIGLSSVIVLIVMTTGAFYHQFSDMKDYQSFAVWYYSVSLIIMAIIFIPAKKLLVHTVTPFLEHSEKSSMNNICYMPLTMFVANFIVTPLGDFITSYSEIISRLVLGILTLFLCRNTAVSYKQMQERRVLYQQIDIQKKYYEALLSNVEEARKTRHDMRHHLIAMDAMIINKEYDELGKYISAMQDRADKEPLIYYTGNSALDGVVYYYMGAAQGEGIDFSFAGSSPKLGDMEIDICALLGNALDNALTACMTATGYRKIDVSIEYDKYIMTIRISNTFDGVYKKNGETFLSRKRDFQKGYGIESMKDICRRYGGSYRFTVKDNVFEAAFLVNL